MGYWNHRIVKQTFQPGTDFEEVFYDIREVYYNDDGSIWAISENATSVFSESVTGVNDVLKWMKAATKKPVVDMDTVVYSRRPDIDDGIDWSKVDDADFCDVYDAELRKLYGNDYRSVFNGSAL